MKIDLKWLKLHPQESEKFHVEAVGRDEFLKELGGRFIAPVKVDLLITNNHRVFDVQGQVQTILELVCSRCLGEVSLPVNCDFCLRMVDSTYSTDNTNEDEMILLDQDIFDLEPYVEAAIFMNLPLNPLCKPDCKGLCPGCGINRNTQQCLCKKEEIDPRWAKLQNLK
ncbi:MAG: DUF177 domain-containing protein, partial [Syntrophomonadaceae bacterium]|nr:DUF177 domain-containing protein [Syntrophomonadaceae bacterium]MDD3022678.1 DUF177 domain-containing protein [Syntrophomonadaceae bacterium]